MFAYLFPGQGSQFVGMGHNLYTDVSSARAVFEQADDVLGIGLTQLCLEGPEEQLNDTYNTQPAILATSVAALRALEETGAGSPAYVAGHSLGEFSALVAAGVLTLKDGLRVVRERGRLMKQAGDENPGGMAAVIALDRDTVSQACTTAQTETGEYVGIANDNCPGQIVISGTVNALERAMTLTQEAGAKIVKRLAVSIGAHSPLMAEASAEFRRVLDATSFETPSVPVVTNATAGPLTEPEEIREAVAKQLTSPVHWTDSMRWLLGQGVIRFVEVGPKDVLCGLMKRIDRKAERLTTEQLLSQRS
jgi:[acyl-carrier-protein] S-malonyltransferase